MMRNAGSFMFALAVSFVVMISAGPSHAAQNQSWEAPLYLAESGAPVVALATPSQSSDLDGSALAWALVAMLALTAVMFMLWGLISNAANMLPPLPGKESLSVRKENDTLSWEPPRNSYVLKVLPKVRHVAG